LPKPRREFYCRKKPVSFNSKPLLGGYAALMLKLMLRFWTPRFRANPRLDLKRSVGD
jgi:hypothetical protein